MQSGAFGHGRHGAGCGMLALAPPGFAALLLRGILLCPFEDLINDAARD